MQVLADAKQVDALIGQLTDQVARWIEQGGDWAIVGIKRRGDVLARRLAQRLNVERVGALDITLYRDDLSELGADAVVRATEVPFDLEGLNVVLVDDVLMTGRSIRAALASLMDLGRPCRVWLAVLVDRGGRELPIAPDIAGMDLTDQALKQVRVMLTPMDEYDAVEADFAESDA